nr:hypothetical protein [Parazoarcus communis]
MNINKFCPGQTRIIVALRTHRLTEFDAILAVAIHAQEIRFTDQDLRVLRSSLHLAQEVGALLGRGQVLLRPLQQQAAQG